MQISTSGLVLRQVKVGEADQILTILTPDRGVLSASARGSLRLKSKLFSGCGLFCYSEFTLTTGRASNFVDAAAVKKVFHGLGRSVEGMALAAYLAEALTVLSPEPPEAETLLRLTLNSLYMISEGKRPLPLIKAIFEMRAMSLSGYMPRILACDRCGKYDGGAFYPDTSGGTLLCAGCAAQQNRSPNLDAGALYALRHICLSEDGKLFAFNLSAASTEHLGKVAERYFLTNLDHTLKSLDFLHTVLA